MKKLALILALLSTFLLNTAFAAEEAAAETTATQQVEAQQEEKTNEEAPKLLLDKDAVDAELAQADNHNCYLELEEGKYFAYPIDVKDNDTRRDLFKKAPAERVNHLLTNNEEIYKYLTEFIAKREKSGRKYYGYRITGGVEENTQLADGTTVYKFWFMKLDGSSGDTRIPIGIGIGIGGGHHRHGPWFGIGW